jgi:hypothetical protein
MSARFKLVDNANPEPMLLELHFQQPARGRNCDISSTSCSSAHHVDCICVGADRALLIWLYRRCPRLDANTIVKPETLVRWHRMGFAAYWRWKSRSKYASSYNEMRTHVSLGKDAPCTRSIEHSKMLLRIRFLAGSTIDTHVSSFQKRHPCLLTLPQSMETRPGHAARMIRGCSSRQGQKESAPEIGALPKFVTASGRDLGRLDLQKLAGARDWDRPRLHRLRNLAHEVDV